MSGAGDESVVMVDVGDFMRFKKYRLQMVEGNSSLFPINVEEYVSRDDTNLGMVHCREV